MHAPPRALAVALPLLCAAPALHAQDGWIRVLERESRTAWLDTASIVRTDSARYNAWSVWRETPPVGAAARVSPTVAEYREYDCDSGRSRVRGVFLLDAQGEAFDARRGDGGWERTAEREPRALVQRLVCILGAARPGPP